MSYVPSISEKRAAACVSGFVVQATSTGASSLARSSAPGFAGGQTTVKVTGVSVIGRHTLLFASQARIRSLSVSPVMVCSTPIVPLYASTYFAARMVTGQVGTSPVMSMPPNSHEPAITPYSLASWMFLSHTILTSFSIFSRSPSPGVVGSTGCKLHRTWYFAGASAAVHFPSLHTRLIFVRF